MPTTRAAALRATQSPIEVASRSTGDMASSEPSPDPLGQPVGYAAVYPKQESSAKKTAKGKGNGIGKGNGKKAQQTAAGQNWPKRSIKDLPRLRTMGISEKPWLYAPLPPAPPLKPGTTYKPTAVRSFKNGFPSYVVRGG